MERMRLMPRHHRTHHTASHIQTHTHACMGAGSFAALHEHRPLQKRKELKSFRKSDTKHRSTTTITTRCTVRAKEERLRHDSTRALPLHFASEIERKRHSRSTDSASATHDIHTDRLHHRIQETHPQNKFRKPLRLLIIIFIRILQLLIIFFLQHLLIQNKIRELCYPPLHLNKQKHQKLTLNTRRHTTTHLSSTSLINTTKGNNNALSGSLLPQRPDFVEHTRGCESA